MRMQFSAPVAGFGVNNVHRLLITYGRANYGQSVALALFITLEGVDDYILNRHRHETDAAT
jgi:hypothetical protein